MTDVLIRDVPEDDLERIDAMASRAGLSRGEYLRRRIHQDAARVDFVFSVDEMRRVIELSADLLDEDVMRDAWS